MLQMPLFVCFFFLPLLHHAVRVGKTYCYSSLKGNSSKLLHDFPSLLAPLLYTGM